MEKKIEDVFKERHTFCFPNIRGTTVNGIIYWLVGYEFHKKIVGFDLNNERFLELPMPSTERFFTLETYLTEIEGSLGIYYIKAVQIIVWKMREIDEEIKGWIKMISITHPYGLRNFHVRHHNKPLCWLENGKILFYIEESTADSRNEFAEYDPKTDKLESYPMDGIHWLKDWVIYSESLVSPNA